MTRNAKLGPNWNLLGELSFSFQNMEDDMEMMEDDLEIMEDYIEIMEYDLEIMGDDLENDQKCLKGQIKHLLGPALYRRSCTCFR
jgi:hypothetical protein